VRQHGQHEDVAEGVAGCGQSCEEAAGGTHARTDEKRPRQQADAERDGEGVEEAGAVTAGDAGAGK